MSKPKTHSAPAIRKQTQTPALKPWQIGVLLGIIALVIGVIWFEQRPVTRTVETDAGAIEDQATLAPLPEESPEAHFDRLRDAGMPIFAFFHSDGCYQCAAMSDIVAEVYPDFAASVALVDVDIHAPANRSLVGRVGIRAIPTMIFFDRSGTGEGAMGVISAEELRAALEKLNSQP